MSGPDYPLVTERVNHPLIPSIAQSRIDTFFAGVTSSQNVFELCHKGRWSGPGHVTLTCWSAPGDSKPTFDEALAQLSNAQLTKTIEKDHLFGPAWTNHWLKVELSFPNEVIKANQEVIFEFDPSCEALVYDTKGEALHGITGTAHNQKPLPFAIEANNRVEHIIPSKAVKDGKYTCYIEVTCNGMFGCGAHNANLSPPDEQKTYTLRSATIVLPAMEVRKMYMDFQVLRQVAQSQENRLSSLPKRALKALSEIMDSFHRDDELEQDPEYIDKLARKCREIAWEVLGDPEAQKVLPHNDKGSRQAKVWAIGHCHIDTAWLWRYTQTQQKVARSWSSQCDLMDRWPTYEFAASSAQQYTWLQEFYPATYDRVKQWVKKGQFHPVGGAWLEHDCMLPSGESLARQYLYGQRYFKSHFGEPCREAWLPDTFGYASQLPQILRLTGINYFFTHKLSWNNITTFPYSTFNWVALDGTQVLAHMTPWGSYNGKVNFVELEKCMWNNKNADEVDESLLLFGNGDGGGGPTPQHLQKLDRMASLAAVNPEVPKVANTKPSNFFDYVCEKTNGGEKLPTWRGELYLEFHRGTYTTQSNVKAGNRRMEQLLRDLEYFATMASLQVKGYEYPKPALDELWQDTLLNQFHDVLPGSTISMCVTDALEIYERRIKQAEQLIEEALKALYPETSPLTASNSPTDHIMAVDALHTPRGQVLAVGDAFQMADITAGGTGTVSSLPSTGFTAPRAYKDGETTVLENRDFRLGFSKGRLSSLIDRHLDRELILPGVGAETAGLMMYDDYPLKFDAWDVEIYHLNAGRAILFDSAEPEEHGRRASVKAVAKFGHSLAELTFSLDNVPEGTAETDRSVIQIDAKIQWHEKHQVLKFALPVDVHSPHAVYGTQFGLVERPTHRNTLFDQAKFEVCAHMLADLSETGYGVALASPNKYGYAIEGNTLRLSLLRAPKFPDPTADLGEHSFSMAIMPHVGRLTEGGTYKKALAYANQQSVYLRSVSNASAIASEKPSFTFEGGQCQGVVLETVKRAEDSPAVVLRMFEALGSHARGTLVIRGIKFGQKVEWVNILEETLPEKCAVTQSGDGCRIEIDCRPFEIKTLKLALA